MKRDELVRLLELDAADPVSHGHLRAAKMQLDRDDPLTPKIERMVDEMLTARTREPAVMPQLPWAMVYRTHDAERRPLSESDYRWLDRLPDDLTKVGAQDAEHLARLMKNAEPGSADERLLLTYYQPVAEHYERQRAEAYVRDFRAKDLPVPPLPASAVEVLAEAVRAEVPELSPGEATARARAQVAQVERARADRHATERARLEAEATGGSAPGGSAEEPRRSIWGWEYPATGPAKVPSNWWEVPAS